MLGEWYNTTMNESATRKDIDEVIGIMRDFKGQVSGKFDGVYRQFDEVNLRLDRFDRDYDHLINDRQLHRTH